MCGITKRVKNRGELIRNVIGNLKRIIRGDHQIISERTRTIHTHTHGVAT